jgi:hypothetical protein
LRARKTPSGIIFDAQLPENVGYERDLNTVFGTPGSPGANLEEDVTRLLDEPFRALHQRMISVGVHAFTPSERFEVARHLCALQIRNPRIIREYLEPASKVPFKPSRHMLLSEVKEIRKIERQFRKMFHSDFDSAKFASHLMLHNLDQYASVLGSKAWVVVPYPPDKGLLVTGDLPFISTLDFGSPRSIFIFPMSPSWVLVIHKDFEDLLKLMPVHMRYGFAFVNFFMVSKNVEVYFQNPTHKKFIEKYLGCLEEAPKDEREAEYLRERYKDFLRYVAKYMSDLGVSVR